VARDVPASGAVPARDVAADIPAVVSAAPANSDLGTTRQGLFLDPSSVINGKGASGSVEAGFIASA